MALGKLLDGGNCGDIKGHMFGAFFFLFFLRSILCEIEITYRFGCDYLIHQNDSVYQSPNLIDGCYLIEIRVITNSVPVVY